MWHIVAVLMLLVAGAVHGYAFDRPLVSPILHSFKWGLTIFGIGCYTLIHAHDKK